VSGDIARLVVRGRDRAEAAGRLRRALVDTAVVLRHGLANKALLLEALGPDPAGAGVHADAALLRAALAAHDDEEAVAQAQFYATAARGRPRLPVEIGRAIELSHAGQVYRLTVRRGGADRYRVDIDDLTLPITLQRHGEHEARLRLGRRSHRVLAVPYGDGYLVEVDGGLAAFSRAAGALVRAPAPAMVLSVARAARPRRAHGRSVAGARGDEDGDAGVRAVRRAHRRGAGARQRPGGHWRAAAPLRTAGDDRRGRRGAHRLRTGARRRRDPGRAGRAQHRRSAAVAARLRRRSRRPAHAAGGARRRGCGAGARRRPPVRGRGGAAGDLRRRPGALSPARRRRRGRRRGRRRARHEEYLLAYLRTRGRGAEQLPERFLERLARAVAHYGVASLDPSPALDAALFRLYGVPQRAAQAATIVRSVLERWLIQRDALAPQVGAPSGACSIASWR
jgi:hypothetical protein